MALLVQKYGGSSVADAERIRMVASRVAEARRAGHDVVVVISAMGDTTDDLIALAKQVTPSPPEREMDMLLTAGERIAMALLAMAIHEEGVEAMSLTGSQAGILTDTSHGQAKILEIKGDRVRDGLRAGRVVIVAGYQGVSPDTKDVTTLGRGGSDATAVALAAALGADACEIFTDVDGVYTGDPRLVPEARKLDEVTYEEMLELAGAGARVLMLRSVEFARGFDIPLHVRSSFHDRPGTWVKGTAMEQAIVSGITHDATETKITVRGVPHRPGAAAELFGPIAAQGINVDMIVQHLAVEGTTDISFMVPATDTEVARAVAEVAAGRLRASGVQVDEGVAKVSVVGAGMRSHPGVAALVFSTLAEQGITIEMISTSSIRISCVVPVDRVEEAVRALHAAFDPPTYQIEEVQG
jgi:aspartate kinase